MTGWIERKRKRRSQPWSRYKQLLCADGYKYRTDQYNYGSRRFNWPYCLQQQEDKSWVVLNRDYKPLNMYAPEYTDVDYKPFSRKLPRLTKKVRDELHGGNRPFKDEGYVHLYFDGNVPERSLKCERAYERRLALLSWVLGDDDRLWRHMFWTDERIYAADQVRLLESG